MTPVMQISSRSPLAFYKASISWCRMETRCKLYFQEVRGLFCFNASESPQEESKENPHRL